MVAPSGANTSKGDPAQRLTADRALAPTIEIGTIWVRPEPQPLTQLRRFNTSEVLMEVVRGIGLLCVVFGLTGIMVRFGGPMRFRAEVRPHLARTWPIAGRMGAALLGIGLALMLISAI
jgi:hypothetical protein